MTDAIPSILARDQRFGPLSRLTERVSGLDLSVFLVNLIDTVQPDVLPLLAEQFHIHGEEGWTLAESDDARRALLHSANELHRYKGTPWAIREVIRRLGLGEVTLIEGLAGQQRNGLIRRNGYYVHGDPTSWNQYRVLLSQPITNDQAAQLRRMLALYAPARCQLASLEYQAVANRHNGAIRRNKQFNRGTA
ncbi:phage tail protein [Chromobacterium piscinae]|uniref:phage tail protein n=1 Tax=Chromobacterium piscinae TaxID=686831 RepID=UPI00140921C5|nr:phage tail protein [Chromobacterium piscinae]MCD5326917.1 phage tail protein [Chromobacterium piscinae]NHQ83639.1 phage tail protein [Chromobacterium vaccinii]